MADTTTQSHMPPEWRPRESERASFVQCSLCRWWYDMRALQPFLYHAYRDHEPPQRTIIARSA